MRKIKGSYLKKRNRLFIFLIIFVVFLSSCRAGESDNAKETFITPTGSLSVSEANQNDLLACDLVTNDEWYGYFQETPLMINPENGGCLISNQWNTRSIFIGVYQGDQAKTALRWFTTRMSAGWNAPDIENEIQDLVVNSQDISLGDFLYERIPIFEQMQYRTEKVITIGDYSLWSAYYESLTNILEIVESDKYIRIEMIGFYGADAQEYAFQIARKILERIPQNFTVVFSMDDSFALAETPTPTSSVEEPEIDGLSISSKEIFYGSLCNQEVTTFTITLSNSIGVQEVFLVYRLISPTESNMDYVTTIMDYDIASGSWRKTLSAEKSFSAYALVPGAKVEYSFAIIYGVNGVLRSSNFSDIIINPCSQ